MEETQMMFDRRVPSDRHENTYAKLSLPLNLIALVITFVDDPADLSRMCRTCRLFHYMTLPSLYSRVSLRSYDHIRYDGADGRPQGCGMASPFAMALSGLASRNVAGYVKEFEVCGEWKEYELQEHARVGRVSDGSMMMNTVVRVAVERMQSLESFSWQMTPKMLPTMWQGLSQNSSLKRLTVKFPSTRYPQPIALAPPISSLEYLHIHDIDPLCYEDDISLLLVGSTNLRHLKMHWSPRMRQQREPSIHPITYFGRCEAAKYQLQLKTVSFVNFFVGKTDSCNPPWSIDVLEECTVLDSVLGTGEGSSMVFMEERGSKDVEQLSTSKLKLLRINKISPFYCRVLSYLPALEKIYWVGRESPGNNNQPCVNGHANGQPTPSPGASTSQHTTPSDTSSTPYPSLCGIATQKEAHLEMLCKSHGPRLRHLLLLPEWRLNQSEIALLVRRCPNLEQLALGVEEASLDSLKLLLPFLPNLTALRILPASDMPGFVDRLRELDRECALERNMGRDSAQLDFMALRWIELGCEDLLFEIGPVGSGAGEGFVRDVHKRSRSAVKDVAIWSMDSYML